MSETFKLISEAVRPLAREFVDNIPPSVKDFAAETTQAIKNDTKTLKERIMNVADITKVETGERFNLTKEVGESITKYSVCLDWNDNGKGIDCDASAVLVFEDGSKSDMVYYGNPKAQGVMTYGDNRTGADGAVSTPRGSDEQLDIDLTQVPANVKEIIIIASTYATDGVAQKFGVASDPLLVLYADGVEKPVLSYELDEENSTNTCVEVGKLYRKNGDWRFVSMGTGLGNNPKGLECLNGHYGLF